MKKIMGKFYFKNAGSVLFIMTGVLGMLLALLPYVNPFEFPMTVLTSGYIATMFLLFSCTAVYYLMQGVSKRIKFVAYLTAVCYAVITFTGGL